MFVKFIDICTVVKTSTLTIISCVYSMHATCLACTALLTIYFVYCWLGHYSTDVSIQLRPSAGQSSLFSRQFVIHHRVLHLLGN